MQDKTDPLEGWYHIIGAGIGLIAFLLLLLAVLEIWIQSYWLLVTIGALFFFGAGLMPSGGSHRRKR